MKTICSCFTGIVAIMFGLILNGICLICNFIEKDWGWFAWDIVVIILGVLAIRGLYKRAKSIEEAREASIRMIYDVLPIDRIIVHRIMSEFFKTSKKDKEDEVEEHNGTPV